MKRNAFILLIVAAITILGVAAVAQTSSTSVPTTGSGDYEITFYRPDGQVPITWFSDRIPVNETWNIIFEDNVTGKKVRIMDNVVVREQ